MDLSTATIEQIFDELGRRYIENLKSGKPSRLYFRHGLEDEGSSYDLPGEHVMAYYQIGE